MFTAFQDLKARDLKKKQLQKNLKRLQEKQLHMEHNTKRQHPCQGGFQEIKYGKPSGYKREVFQIQS